MHLPIIATWNPLSSHQREICHPWWEKRESRFSIQYNPLYATWARQRKWEQSLHSQGSIFSLWGNLQAQRSCPTLLPCSLAVGEHKSPALNLLTLEPGAVWFPQLGQQVYLLKTDVTRILLEKKLLGKFNNTIMPPKYTTVPSWPCDKIMTISQCINPPVSYCYLPTEGYSSYTEELRKYRCTPYPCQH